MEPPAVRKKMKTETNLPCSFACLPTTSSEIAQCENVNESLLEKILRISVIANEVWKHLTLRQLQQCRLVSAAWRESVTVEMVRRDLYHLHFVCPKESPFFVHRRWPHKKLKLKLRATATKNKVGAEGSQGGSLQELNALLTRGQGLDKVKSNSKSFPISNYFPCSSFTFTDGDLNEENAKLFFDRHGRFVRSLTLKRIKLTAQILCNLFSGQLSNLRKLSLVSLQLVPELEPPGSGELASSSDFDGSSWTLPFLNTVHLDLQGQPLLSMHMLSNMMVGSPNLKIIGNLPLPPGFSTCHPNYNLFNNSRTSSLFFGLIISLTDSDSEDLVLSGLEALSQLRLRRLQILTLAHPPGARPGSAASCHILNIVENSLLSLTVLHWTFPGVFYLEGASNLVLPNVRHLTVDVGVGTGEKFDSIIIRRIFPQLLSIYLRFINEINPEEAEAERNKMYLKAKRKKMNWSRYFVNSGVSSSMISVKTLEILGSIPDNWWKPMVELFPKAENVAIYPTADGHFPIYELGNTGWAHLKGISYGISFLATPVNERHEEFALSLF